jgi:multimeric flavodoxin WrbA
MPKIILISGSPRKGNTEAVTEKFFKDLNKKNKAELVLLRKLKFKPCLGCETCEKKKDCVIDDDLRKLHSKLIKVDKIYLFSPNNFCNVSGLMKIFMDRTNNLWHKQALAGKKLVSILVGARSLVEQNRINRQIFGCFAIAHKMKHEKFYSFKAEKVGEISGHM